MAHQPLEYSTRTILVSRAKEHGAITDRNELESKSFANMPRQSTQTYYPDGLLGVASPYDPSVSPTPSTISHNPEASISRGYLHAGEELQHPAVIKRSHSVADSETRQAELRAQQHQIPKRSVSSIHKIALPINTSSTTAIRHAPGYPKSSSVIPSDQNHADADPQSFLGSYKAPQRVQRISGLASRRRAFHVRLEDWKSTFPLDRLIYQPLRQGNFRLLVIEPATQDQTIQCRLYKAKLSDSVEYEALSYVWGTEPATFEIKVNCQPLMIRPNLHNALRRLRGKERVCVWVDTLCINQADPFEKSEQIQNMGQIYRKAKSVCIWLGEEDQHANIAFEFVNKIHRLDFFHTHNPVDGYGVTALCKVLERPWFRRLWVLQEASSARNAIMLCGGLAIHMNDLIDALALLRERLGPQILLRDTVLKSVNILNECPGLRFLDAVKMVFQKSQDGEIVKRKMTLESLTEMSAFLETTDLRDTIYALLNLANDSARYPILPDYGRDLLSVFTDFIKYSVAESRSLDIILRPWAPISAASDIKAPLDVKLKANRPSWICSRNGLPFGNPAEEHKTRIHPKSLVGSVTKRIYNADNSTYVPSFFGAHERLRISRYDMMAYGIVLGMIQEQSMRMADGIVQQECLDILDGIKRDEEGVLYDLSDSVWRVICANRDGSGKPAPDLIYRRTMLGFLDRPSFGKGLDTEELLKEDFPETTMAFLRVVRDTVWNRRTFRGTGPYGELLGLSPRYAREGDIICILYGCSVPVVLRPSEDIKEECWQLIGEAYVDGMMEGEIFRSMDREQTVGTEVQFVIR